MTVLINILLFFSALPLFLSQEALFPTTNQTKYHIGNRVIQPKPNTLFHLKGSEIITCFDSYSTRFKSSNYLTGETLNVREVLFQPKQLVYYKNDSMIMVDQNDFSLKIFNMRYALISDILVNFEFGDEFSIIVSSFMEKDVIVAFGKKIFSVFDLKSNKIIATFNDSSLNITALNYFPEKKLIVTIDGNSLIIWTLFCDCESGNITKIETLSENMTNSAPFIERIGDTQRFLSYDQEEKTMKIWDLTNTTFFSNITIEHLCRNKINRIKSIDDELLLIICDETNVFIFEISSEKVQYNDTRPYNIIDVTIIKDKALQSVGLLTENGNIDVLNLKNWTYSKMLNEKYRQIDEILDITYLNFYNNLIPHDQNTSGLIAIRSNTPDNRTVHIINAYNETYLKNITIENKVKKVLKLGFSDSFLIWFDNGIVVYNMSTLEFMWNYTNINYTIDLVDSAFIGHNPKIDALSENNIIIFYSKAEGLLKFFRSNGEFITEYALLEDLKNIKFFCMLNTFDSLLYMTESDDLVKVSYDMNSSEVNSSKIYTFLNETFRCKNDLYNYGDKKILVSTKESLKVIDFDENEAQEYVNQTFYSISPLSHGDLLVYDTYTSIATAMTYNYVSREINPATINSNFKDAILLNNNKGYLTGYYFNEKESFETVFTSNCEESLQINPLGICIVSDFSNSSIDEYSTNLVSECPEDSYKIHNYLGTNSEACRKCGVDIPNCLSCSSAENCLNCEENYHKVALKGYPTEISYCLHLENIQSIENSENELFNIIGLFSIKFLYFIKS